MRLKFVDFIGDDVLVGYNINSFDLNVLYDIQMEITGEGIHNDFIDILPVAKAILPGLENYRLTTICDYLGVDSSGAHRALNDVKMTKEVYELICSEYGNGAFSKHHPKSRTLKKQRKEKSITEQLDLKEINGGDIDPCDISIMGRHCVLTGEFACGSRDTVMEMIVAYGGIADKSVRKVTDYVIVGSNGSASWKNGNYGSKIEKAIELKAAGQEIRFLSEDDFMKYIKEADETSESAESVISLDDTEAFGWEADIRTELENYIADQKLPNRSLRLVKNISRQSGEVTSYSVAVYESDYPPRSLESGDEEVNAKILMIREKTRSVKKEKVKTGELEITLNEKQFREACAEGYEDLPLKKTRADGENIRVTISKDDDRLPRFVMANTECCMKYYVPAAKQFGCCSRYDACSDAVECLHPNKLYARACMYYQQLSKGRIFYGKNRNID